MPEVRQMGRQARDILPMRAMRQLGWETRLQLPVRTVREVGLGALSRHPTPPTLAQPRGGLIRVALRSDVYGAFLAFRSRLTLARGDKQKPRRRGFLQAGRLRYCFFGIAVLPLVAPARDAAACSLGESLPSPSLSSLLNLSYGMPFAS
jgi:hypothetical protein